MTDEIGAAKAGGDHTHQHFIAARGEALAGLAMLGASADIEAGGASLLATAIGERRSVSMMDLLVAQLCVHRWRYNTAMWAALQAHPVDAWREAIERLLSKAVAADAAATRPCQLCSEE
jgi:hypothetical protein